MEEHERELRVRLDAFGSREHGRQTEHDGERETRVRDPRGDCEELQEIRRHHLLAAGSFREREEHAAISEREAEQDEELAERQRERDEERGARERRRDALVEQKPARRERPEHDVGRSVHEDHCANDARDEAKQRVHAAPRGSCTVNVEPWPTLLSRSIEPPIIVARRRAIASPRPVPR